MILHYISYHVGDTLILLLYSALSIQLIFLVFFFSRVILNVRHTYNSKIGGKSLPPVSILIPISNYKEENILKLISILNKSNVLIDYELVLVMYSKSNPNGVSFDSIKKQHRSVKVIELHQESGFIRGNKYPIAIGVKSASNEHIILTQEDCLPISSSWLVNVLEKFDDKVELILGRFNYQNEGTFFNQFIRFENAHYTMQFLSFALSKNPIMGTSKNMAFTKSVFYRNKGFSFFNDFIGGEESLFVSTISNSFNTKVDDSAGSLVFYSKNINFKSWLFHKKIYLSTIKYYKLLKKITIILYVLSYVLIFPVAILITFFNIWDTFSLNLFVSRMALYYLILSLVLFRFNEKKLIKWIPIMDICLVFYYYYISVNFFRNPKKIY